jgi:hypothetical protein
MFKAKLFYFSITRNNASSNDTLINAFKKHYQINNIKFEKDTACVVHVLNIAVQAILKALIKNDNDYNAFNNQKVYNVENENEENNENLNSKLFILI